MRESATTGNQNESSTIPVLAKQALIMIERVSTTLFCAAIFLDKSFGRVAVVEIASHPIA